MDTEFKTQDFGDLMPNNGLAIMMAPEHEDVEIRVLEHDLRNMMIEITEMLSKTGVNDNFVYALLDKVQEYAELHYKIKTLREA